MACELEKKLKLIKKHINELDKMAKAYNSDAYIFFEAEGNISVRINDHTAYSAQNEKELASVCGVNFDCGAF